ncbi:MAG: acireductone synthase [Myxococcales bacterium]|nr:acireductone synthase [Myxococcales bacterium]
MAITAVVTDIEGTTSSLRFVHEVLFPYARERLAAWLAAHASEQRVVEVLTQVRAETGEPEATVQRCAEALVGFLDADRKWGPLKQLQGWIWTTGYAQGDFTGHVYADAVAGLERWHDQGLRLFVYSSGSVHAQELLFGHSDVGDLTALFEGHFDTGVGKKTEAASYTTIAARIGCPPSEILFLSDVLAELGAASEAGLVAAQLVRDGQATGSFPTHDTFATIHPLEMP